MSSKATRGDGGIWKGKGVSVTPTKAIGEITFDDAVKCFKDNDDRIDPEKNPVLYNMNHGLLALAFALRNQAKKTEGMQGEYD